MEPDLEAAMELLEEHFTAFHAARPFAETTGHSVPSDTKSYSEILVALLSGIPGRFRKKGSDLADGSDVKAANVWSSIDTPRFNGCAPAGRTTNASRKAPDVSAFDDMPHLFLVLWDSQGEDETPRCRVWVVSPPRDPVFRAMVTPWYEQRVTGQITSSNFQLQPPRNLDTNVIRNSFGQLEYPLFFAAERSADGYEVLTYDPAALQTGVCRSV